jgi:ankyrin repeat protein
LASLLKEDHVVKLVDVADEQGLTPVHWALNCNNFEAFVQLAGNGATIDLRKKRDPSHVLSGVGASYMHALASLRLDNPSYAQLLIDHGVASTVKDGRGLSALSLALKRGTFRLARLLIENGASLAEQDIFGVTPIGEVFLPDQAQQHEDLAATLM